MKNQIKQLQTKFSKEQHMGTGMAMTLLLLLASQFFKNDMYLKIAVLALVVTMVLPRVMYPLSIIWYGLSHVLGIISSKIILSVLFFLFVLPFGIFRRLTGKDSLNLKSWKQGTGTVMKIRNYTYRYTDLEHPF